MARQYTDHSPLPPRPPKPPAEFIPYIYSEQDVRALLDAVDARFEEDWLVRPQTIRTLLLLLYATGLRISEALALKKADVNLAEAILTIRETKFYKSRLVPIGADLVGVLRHYRDQRDGKRARTPRSYPTIRVDRSCVRPPNSSSSGSGSKPGSSALCAEASSRACTTSATRSR